MFGRLAGLIEREIQSALPFNQAGFRTPTLTFLPEETEDGSFIQRSEIELPVFCDD